MKTRVLKLMGLVRLSALGTEFTVLVKHDRKDSRPQARVYLQLSYVAMDHETKTFRTMAGRKWYLSEHMTDDEILKTAYAAFRMAVEHEVLEGFQVDGVRVFDPHRPVSALLGLSEVVRRGNARNADDTDKADDRSNVLEAPLIEDRDVEDLDDDQS